MLDQLRHDLRHAFNALRHQPTLTLTALLVLALAIGANAAIFSIVRGVLLRPLPWPESDRLVRVREYRTGDTRGWRFAGLTNDTYDTWQRSARLVDAIGAWSGRAFTLSGEGEAVRLQATAVTPSMFNMLGFVPEHGRAIRAEESRPGTDHVVILSHQLWRTRFNGDPRLVGRSVKLDGESYAVVGIAPPSFYFPDRESALWVPLFVPPPDRSDPENRSVYLLSALARLRPGVTPQQGSAEATSAAREHYDASNMAMDAMLGQSGPPTVELRPVLDTMTENVRPALLVLFGAVAVVLLVSCANLASLLLSRGLARRRELAVRAAIGAGGGRLARLLFLETLLLALAGGVLGVALARLLLRLLPRVAPADFPRLTDIVIDPTVLLFTLGVSGLAAILFGTGPALQAGKVNLVEALNEGGAAIGGGLRRLGVNRARSALLVGEIALAITLLFGAGLLARSFVRLVSIDPGYDPNNVLTARVSFNRNLYTPPRIAQALDTLLGRLRGLPGVQAAGSINLLPLIPGESMVIFSDPLRGDARGPEAIIRARFRVVSPGLVEALGLRMPRGRAFGWNDTRAAAPALMVNEAFVREHLRGRDPLQTRLPGALEGAQRDWHIVGVVGDVRQASLTADPMPEVWASWTQLDRGLQMIGGTVTLAVRTTGDPLAIAPRLREFVRAIDPELPVSDVMTMERRLAASVAQPRFASTLLGGLALLALFLAGTGIYGVLAYSVTQRRRELGVRSVLGATPSSLVRMVLAQGLALTVVGLLAGVLGALLIAPLLASLLYGVKPSDPPTLAGVALAVLGVAAIAAALPAWRATRVDPAEVLRAN